MESLEKFLTLLRGDLLLFKKGADEKHAELLNALKERDEKDEESDKPVIDAIDRLASSMKPPVVNVPAPIVNVDVPKVVIPNIEVPPIIVPKINVPEAKVTVKIPEIKVPEPKVTVNVDAPIVNIPEEMEVKGLKGWMAKIISVLEGWTPYSIFKEVSYDKPIPTVLVDPKGRPYTAIGGGLVGSSGTPNGATADKQDEIIAAISSIGGSAKYALRLDEASATVTYVGEAAIGSATASAVWRIKKLDSTSGLVITWADGDELFDNVWDNRASLSYS